MAKVWKRLRKIAGKYNAQRPPCVKINVVIETDHKKVANALGNKVSYISSTDNYSEHFRNIKAAKERIKLNFDTTEQFAYNDKITVTEIDYALKTSKDTAPGKDKLQYSMIKNISNSAIRFLQHIFNKVFIEKVFPITWSKAMLLPFQKPNKDPTSVDNYRPIALTKCLCKLLEKIINFRLIFILEQNQVLSPYQLGFRKMRCTTDGIAKIETYPKCLCK